MKEKERKRKREWKSESNCFYYAKTWRNAQ